MIIKNDELLHQSLSSVFLKPECNYCPLHQIPRSYLTLQEAVSAEKQRRDAEGEVQYLTEAQLDCIVEQNLRSDIRYYDDLQTGTSTSSANPELCNYNPFPKSVGMLCKMEMETAYVYATH